MSGCMLVFPPDPVLCRKMTLIDQDRDGCGWVVCGKNEVTAMEHKSNWLCWLMPSCYVQAESHVSQNCDVECVGVGNQC